jgi:hypothetical protein
LLLFLWAGKPVFSWGTGLVLKDLRGLWLTRALLILVGIPSQRASRSASLPPLRSVSGPAGL